MGTDFAFSSRRNSKKNRLQPHLKKTWCIGIMNSMFIARMERILWLYGLPYDPRFPLLCYDERPCFLIGELVTGLQMKAGQPPESITPMKKMVRAICWLQLNH